MDNFDVKFEETLSAFNVNPSETDNSFNAEGDSVIVIPQGGECKIQSISVNGEEQPIVNKNVDIKVPTKTSDLLNDSGFATTNDIPTKVSDLLNDSNFIDSNTLEKTKQELKDYVDENDQVGDENIIESVSVNGTPQTITNKNVNIIIPENTGGTIDDFVKVTKTVNSLSKGDTLFKGDTITFDVDTTKLLTYFLKEPIWTHIYLVNKDTNAGFRFACYVKHIYTKGTNDNPTEKKFIIDIQVHYIDSDTKQFILERSIPITVKYVLGIPIPSFPNDIETTYSFENTVKDIPNLYIHYTNSLKENNAGEGFIGGITARKVSEVQDTLLNVKNGVEAPINNYVKVKNDKIVKIEDNVEKLIPINEETDKKIDELENKVNDANVVNINGFVLNEDNSWISEKQLKEFRPPKDKLNYIAQKENNLYYYTYRDFTENVGFVKGNSGFYETTISGKPMYTSNQVSTIREGTPARVDKNVKGLSSVSFDLYMTGLGYTNQYYPEIAFVVDEGRRIAIEVAFSCYDTNNKKLFQLKINRKDKNQIIVADLPYTNDTFNSNIKIEIKNNVLIVYKDGEKFSETSLDVICPELYDFRDLENIYFGLRYDKTPPTWGFSNVVFEKQYWEQGYKIQDNTLYVNLEDNTLYRYTEDTTTKPYPNFISVSSNQKGTVYVESKQTEGIRPINSEDTLELGQTIYVDTSKLSIVYYEINTDNGQLALTDTKDYYGWGIEGCGLFGHGDFQPKLIQALTPNSGMVEYHSHLSGKITSLTPNTPFYIYGTITTSKAVYNEQGETKQLDLSMLSDANGLLGEVGGNTGSIEIIAVDDRDEDYKYVRIPLKGHSKCYILPFNRSMDGISIISDRQRTGYIGKETSSIGVVSNNGRDETFSVAYNASTDEILISPIFYQGGSSPVNVLLFD